MSITSASGSTSTMVPRMKTTGYHVLKIYSYSQIKERIFWGELKSSDFLVGDHTWRISYKPVGCIEGINLGWISVKLELLEYDRRYDSGITAEVQFRFSLLDEAGEPAPSCFFNGDMHTFLLDSRAVSIDTFIKIEDLENSEYLSNDCFSIRCDIDILKGIKWRAKERCLPVPPSDLHSQLGYLLSSKEGADVVFAVGDETFHAHRCVLAARSPVFKAELFGSGKPAGATPVTIHGMDARAFEALLHFMYTDTLPLPLPEMTLQDALALTRQLHTAADRYKVERLKLVCMDKLRSFIVDMSTVSTAMVGTDRRQQQRDHGGHRGASKLSFADGRIKLVTYS